MNRIQKIMHWIKSPKSDVVLLMIVIVLLNVVGLRSFFRLDITERNSYSLSEASKALVKTVDEPLGVKVFFSEKLPAPYNSVERYLRDILVEYKAAANKNFSYEFYDMSKPENQQIARGYGLSMVQIQEVKDSEVGFKNAYMGIALVYGDTVEKLDGLVSSDSLEYRLTTTMSMMLSKVSSLSGLQGKVLLSLYASDALGNFGIAGYKNLDSDIQKVFSQLNKKNMGKIDYSFVRPSTDEEVSALNARYGLQKISWSASQSAGQSPATEAGSGVLGLVISYEDRFKTIPITLSRNFFGGGYAITGLDNLFETLEENLQALLSRSQKVGYTTTHGEKSLSDDQMGAAQFASISKDLYEFSSIDLSQETIPSSMTTIIINGPTSSFSEKELYALDQFILKGGNLLLFLDPFQEVQNTSNAGYGAMSTYVPVSTGLDRLLEAYGLRHGKQFVMDKNCYILRQQGTPEMPLYYVPIIEQSGMSKKSAVSAHLAKVLFLQTAPLSVIDTSSSRVTYTALATTSKESWLLSENISLSPYTIAVPTEENFSPHAVAYLAEGYFNGAFARQIEDTEKSSAFTSNTHLSSAVQKGKIIVFGSSLLTTSALINENQESPIRMLLRNSLDYLSGNESLADMRTKGLSLNPLKKTTAHMRSIINALNLYVLPFIIVLIGGIAWRKRIIHRRNIRAAYDSHDPREKEAVK